MAGIWVFDDEAHGDFVQRARPAHAAASQLVLGRWRGNKEGNGSSSSSNG
jgi:hypothetical protein